MSGPLYPTSPADIDRWRLANGTTLVEARARFAQFAVLTSIAAAGSLQPHLALKGGNALRFVYGNPRSTLDLDFTALPATESGGVPDDAGQIRQRLDAAFASALTRFGVKMRCQRVERKPPIGKGTLPTYDIGIGYQFPGERYYPDFETSGRTVSTVVKVEVSFNDVVCQTEQTQLAPNTSHLTVCSLDDIVAEKLRALLQQIPRNRTRAQDVFDLHSMMRSHAGGLKPARIADFLVRKSVDRQIVPAKAAFDEHVREKARSGYEQLQVSQADLVPFDTAWATVLRLVDALPLPVSGEPV